MTQPPSPHKLAQITGNLGMYYVCYQLSLRNWNAMPTSRNARGIDIIAYPFEADCFIGIQVKTVSKRSAIPLGTSLEKVMGDCWIIVTEARHPTKSPNSFILGARKVRTLAKCNGRKEGGSLFFLEISAYEKDEFKDNWVELDNMLAQKRGTKTAGE